MGILSILITYSSVIPCSGLLALITSCFGHDIVLVTLSNYHEQFPKSLDELMNGHIVFLRLGILFKLLTVYYYQQAYLKDLSFLLYHGIIAIMWLLLIVIGFCFHSKPEKLTKNLSDIKKQLKGRVYVTYDVLENQHYNRVLSLFDHLFTGCDEECIVSGPSHNQ